MVLVSIPICLLFQSILVASDPYLTLSSLNVICIYLLLICLLSDMSGSLFSLVIMLLPLISKMLIYMLLLLSIMIGFMICLAQYAIPGESFTFRDDHRPWVFMALMKPILFLCCHKGFFIVIYLDDILVLVHSKQVGKSAQSFLCSLLICLGLHINFLKSDLHIT